MFIHLKVFLILIMKNSKDTFKSKMVDLKFLAWPTDPV